MSPEAYSGATAIATVKQPESRFDALLGELYAKFGHHPLFAKLRGVKLGDNPLLKKGAELADDIRDKYETSDHPAVHKVEVGVVELGWRRLSGHHDCFGL